MVPGTATAALQVPSADAAIAMEEAFYQFIEANPVSGTIEADNTYVKIELVGKAHMVQAHNLVSMQVLSWHCS